MIPSPLKVTLGRDDYEIPLLTLGQIRLLRTALLDDTPAGRDDFSIACKIIEIATGRQEDQIQATIGQTEKAAAAILEFAGFQTPKGEVAGAPVKTPETDSDSYTGA